MGKKEETSGRSQPLSWALRTNQLWVYREGTETDQLDKLTEVRNGEEIVEIC